MTDQADDEPERRPAGRHIARNTAIFSAATGLSRIAGLAREVLASYYFGTSGAFSAFTIANQIPNVVRSFFADAALSAAFVPVFTELMEKGQRREAYRLASSLLLLIAIILGALTVVFMLVAEHVVPLFLAEEFKGPYGDLTSGLSILLFPTVLLLALNGVVVGVLNAADHFTIPALSPVVWNLVIMVVLVSAQPFFTGDDELYAYAAGILAGTLAQFAMAVPVLRRVGFSFSWTLQWDARVRRVLVLMLPITLSLGLINVGALIASVIASDVSDDAPRAIEAAFRIYMLPQGIFSVAIATVLFPALSRMATRGDFDGLRDLLGTGTRQILLTLVPAAAVSLVLAEPITRLVYERGAFDAASTEVVSEALVAFSFSLPLSGLNLLLTRTFFSLQRPWATTAMAAVSLVVQVGASILLAGPLGVGGIVLGIGIGNLVLVAAQARLLRSLLQRLDGAATLRAAGRILGATGWMTAVAYGSWHGLDAVLGGSLPAQLISVGVAITAATAVYSWLVLWAGIPEAEQVRALIGRRRARGAG